MCKKGCFCNKLRFLNRGNFAGIKTDFTGKGSVLKTITPIKIFADAHVFDQEFQGSRTFIRELYRHLATKEDLQLYIAAYNTATLKELFPDTSRIHFIRYSTKSGWSRLLFNIRSLLKEIRPDFAHFQYMIPPVKVKGCQYVTTIHDVIFEEYPAEFSLRYRLSKKMLYKMAATNADILTTVSAYSQQSIERFLEVEPGQTHIIPNGVSELFFEPYHKPAVKEKVFAKYGFRKFLLYVSRFEPRKNHTALLRAYLELELYKQDYHLVLPGHRSLAIKEFDNLLQTLPDDIRKFIFISDRVNDEELLSLYRAADLFVYPSRAEGFGISPLEAAAALTPVICSNTSAMQGFQFFGENHINCDDPELLKNRITALLNNPPSSQALKEIAAIIKTRYSWASSAEKFYQLLKMHHQSSTLKKNAHGQLLIS
jgi:glycosyltransferase involved in cell wall biosynthesis